MLRNIWLLKYQCESSKFLLNIKATYLLGFKKYIMKNYIFILIVFVFAACTTNKNDKKEQADTRLNASSDTLLNETAEAIDLEPDSRLFLEQAAYANMMQLESSNNIASETASEEIKNFATMISQEHQMLNVKLNELAKSKGFTLPKLLPNSKVQLIKKMDELKDEGRNEFYVKLIINENQNAIDAFALGSRSKDNEINNFATGALSKLKQNHQQIMNIDTAILAPKAGQGDDLLKISNRNKQPE